MLLLCISACTPKFILFSLDEAPVCHGQDILGLARQNYKKIANNWRQGECLGVLAGTFGGTIKPVEAIISKNNVPAVRWHLSFCNHNNDCQPGECLPTDLKCMQKKAKQINDLHIKYPATKCYISPRCEYVESSQSRVNSWFKAVKEVAPACVLVASPLGGSYAPENTLRERHGNNPDQSHIVSNDGANIFDSDSVAYSKLGTVMNLKWTYRNNLRLSSEKGKPLPPRQRPLTNRLGMQDLEQMQLLADPLPPMPHPAFCKAFRELKNGEIWKNHSEDYGAANDSRGNKPLLILQKRHSTLNIFNASGQKISCMKYFGPYESLYRHYVGSCSGDHAIDLYRKAGHWIFVKDGNACIGLPSIRRYGSFR